MERERPTLRRRHRLAALLVLPALWLGGPAWAASDGLLNGELGRWIDQVAPELGETLSRHPRFAGETVRLVTLSPGAAAGPASNALGRAVERRLRQRLLAIDGVRLAADAPQRGCQAPPTVDYLVRVELSATGGRHAGGGHARVQIAVVDVAESVWVSGISHQWQGRLNGAERRALNQAVSEATPGSAGNPLAAGDAVAVAAAMQADLACLLPRDLAGGVFVEVPAQEALARVALALQRNLMVEPLAAVTADRNAADWVLSLESEPGRGDPREIHLVLRDAGGERPQRVAAVFVAGLGTAEERVAAQSPPPPPIAGADPPAMQPGPLDQTPPAELLSPLRVTPARREGVCDSRRARVNSCVEIDFELHSPAYLFVLSTRNHRVIGAPCEVARRSDAGPRRFRVRLPPGGYAVDRENTGPDGGFYVLATREPAVAEALQAALARAPGQCGTPGDGERAWVEALAVLLDRHPRAIDWRALHLVHDRTGITAL